MLSGTRSDIDESPIEARDGHTFLSCERILLRRKETPVPRVAAESTQYHYFRNLSLERLPGPPRRLDGRDMGRLRRLGQAARGAPGIAANPGVCFRAAGMSPFGLCRRRFDPRHHIKALGTWHEGVVPDTKSRLEVRRAESEGLSTENDGRCTTDTRQDSCDPSSGAKLPGTADYVPTAGVRSADGGSSAKSRAQRLDRLRSRPGTPIAGDPCCPTCAVSAAHVASGNQLTIASHGSEMINITAMNSTPKIAPSFQ